MVALDQIKTELNLFINKYYKNLFLKGLLLCVIIFSFSLYLFSLAEFYGRFSSYVRLGFVVLFVLLNSYFIFSYVILPLSHFIRKSKRLDFDKASKMLGVFFPEIADQLTNLLQLEEQTKSNLNANEVDLLIASIQQKSHYIGFLKFTNAVSYSENKKYLKFIVPSFLLFVLFMALLPAVFTDGSYRVINFSKEFKPSAPFGFQLIDDNLSLLEGQDLNIEVELVGDDFPNKLYINSDQGVFLMLKKKANIFEFKLRKPRNKQIFFFSTSKYKSENYSIEVLGKSILGKWDAFIEFPKYLQMDDKSIINSSDFSLPEGSIVTWDAKVKNVSEVNVYCKEQHKIFRESGFRFKKRFKKSEELKIVLENKNTRDNDSILYFINVIKDAFPQIEVNEEKDSLNSSILFFNGVVSDDYGLSTLNFHYEVSSNNQHKREEVINFQNVQGTKNTFTYSIDLNKENLTLGDVVVYYFSVSDNDGVNGNKTTISNRYTYKAPNLAELNKERTNEQEDIKRELSAVLEATKKFQENVKDLSRKIKKNTSNEWNKLNDLNSLKKEQQNLLNQLEQVKEKMDQSIDKKNELSELDKELLKKQELLEDLLNKVMDDELKKLLEELEELLKQNDQKELNEKMEEIDQNTEDMKKQLDRSLEMLKKLQVNEKIDDIENELLELAEEERGLSKQKDKDSLKQDGIEKKFEAIQKDLNELEKLNNALESPLKLDNTDKDQNQIDKDLKEAGENIEKNKKAKASKSQESAAENMEKLAEKMDQMQQDSADQQQQEDMNELRNILESLLLLSKEQEAVMEKVQNVGVNDPAFRKYGRGQRRINDATKIVKDSLLSLAKRQAVLATFIDKELNDLDFSHRQSIDFVGERNKKKVTQNQQGAMTAYNNLALLLNEVLQTMQAEMQSQKPGSGKCNKPGGKGKPKAGPSMNPGDMKQMLKNQLDALKKGMNKGGKKPGEKEGSGAGKLGNKGLAKIAAEQSAIRKKLEELRNQLNKDGKGTGNGLNPLIKELKEQQKRIVNKNINKETINRQQEILTRLLESEEALIERGFEEKRESNSGKNSQKSNQILLNQYNKEKLKKIELLRFAEPAYKKYYKEKANEYFDEN